ncbi:integrase [Bradyrhizobium sp. AZCC 2262]|uniref:hypothetical protein n=1 Tax=Bradyrhizobium sp. AZCC 2262 TaxID=3117022 RepID=UPI002FF28E03
MKHLSISPIESRDATISPILFQSSDMSWFSGPSFDHRFRVSRTPSKNTSKNLGKSLATKLAILFQRGARDRMHSSTTGTELSLFDRNGGRKYLTAAERRRFLCAVEALDPLKRLFCLVLMRSGGRVSEVLAITPVAIDLDNGDVALLTVEAAAARDRSADPAASIRAARFGTAIPTSRETK